MATKKVGRPTDSVKDYMLRVRLDMETLKQLDKCCEVENLSRSEIVRDNIRERYEKIMK